MKALDCILCKVEKFISQTIYSKVEIYCDTGGKFCIILHGIVATLDRPFLVIVKREAKTDFLQTNCAI